MDNSMNRYGFPSGDEGKKMLDEMNKGHTPMALWSLTNIEFKNNDLTLDVGCGGGINICRIHHKSPNAMTYGVDYSKVSVNSSIQFNKELVDKGEVKILEANVLDMPFDDDMFDVITAFETVYFWPDIEKSFCEVKRILKPNAKFFISLVSSDDDFEVNLKEDPKMEGFIAYDANKIKDLLEKVGFKNIKAFIRKPDDNRKIVRTYSDYGYSDEFVEDTFVNDESYREDSENNRWFCVIAEK